jgi:ATP/maltotriose-dependent transcriptional regulator MalT
VAPVDGARHWFRYQQLFRAFLRDRLEREHPHDLAALHQRASAWYAQAHQFGPAIMHALAAGDRDQAAAFIAAVAADTIMRGEYATLRTWLDQLPETSRDQHPELWLWTAWVAFLNGAVEQIEPALERAAQVWPEVQRGQYVGFAAHLRAQLARLRGDASATVAAATEALAALPPDQPAFRAGSELALGVGQLLSGDQHTAANTLHAALNACRLHYQSGVPAALRALGDLERLGGRNVAAMEWYTAALDVDGAQQGWDYWAAQAGLAAIYVAQAEPAVALELLDAALLHAEQAGVAVYMADAYLTLARGLAALGRRADAEAALFQSRRHARRLGAAELLEMIDQEERQWAAQSEVREAHRVRAVGTPVFEPLSERELEVLRLVALGASNQAIADRLVISVGTVKSHLSRILSKLAAQSRTEAVARARALGMLA